MNSKSKPYNVSNKKSILKLLPCMKPYRLWIILSITSVLITTALTITSTYIMKNLTDEVRSMQFQKFYKFLYIIIAVAAGEMIFTYVEKYATSMYSTYTIRDLRNEITRHMLKLPLYSMKEYNSGDYVSRINNDVSAISELISEIPNYMCQPFLFIGALTYMLIISWKLTLACTILIPVSSVLFDKINKPIQGYSKKRMEHIAEANSSFADMINGIYILKAFNLKEILSKKYEMILKKIQNKSLHIDKISANLAPIFLLLRFIPQLVCPIYGGYLVVQKEMTVGGLIAFIILIWYVFGPIEVLLKFISQIRQAKPSCERILEILNKTPELSTEKEFEIRDSLNAIRFKDVFFSYDGKIKILSNVSFEVPKGKTAAIVGPSGSGKSTIINLLCGFYKIDEGSIEVFGSDVENTDLSALRSQISLVSQDAYLFPTTIFENISYGRPGASKEEVIKAAEEANAHDFIIELPHGYETVLSERGKNLSGGQCQRITLARAILKDAPILLLDEPTSALDLESEALFIKALKEFMYKRTSLIIAHHLSTIKESDEILVINEGLLYERGNHDELMKKDGLYKKLYLKQLAPMKDSFQAAACKEV